MNEQKIIDTLDTLRNIVNKFDEIIIDDLPHDKALIRNISCMGYEMYQEAMAELSSVKDQ